MCWMVFHSNEEAPSTRGQADGGSLWTSSNQHGRETLHRSHESHEQHSGDAGCYRSTVQAEHVRGTGAGHATNDVLITVDSLYVKGLIEKEIRGQRKQGARHVASPHVESDAEKNTTAHSLDTQATWGTPSQIAWQILARARNYSIICFD